MAESERRTGPPLEIEQWLAKRDARLKEKARQASERDTQRPGEIARLRRGYTRGEE